VSRLTNAEATVSVSGLTDELLIQSIINQNRALNADIVAVEVLPKAEWIANYKDVPTDKWMDEGAPEVVPLGPEGEEIVPVHTNLLK